MRMFNFQENPPRAARQFQALALLVCLVGFGMTPPVSGQTADPPLTHPTGSWRDAFPWEEVLEVLWCPERGEGWGLSGTEGFWSIGPGEPSAAFGEDGVWAARTEKGVFIFDARGDALQRWSTVDALSGVGATGLAFDLENQTLIIAYVNGLLDFVRLDGTRLFTLTDIRDSNLIGSKAIHSLTFVHRADGDVRLLAACAFGVVEIHPRTFDVRNTWYIEGQQDLRSVWGVRAFADRYVVWTDKGVFEAQADHPFLNAAAAWERWADVPLEEADYRHVLWTEEGAPIVVLRNEPGVDGPRDEVHVQAGGLWQPMPGWTGARVDCAATSGTGAGPWWLALGDFNTIQFFGGNLLSPEPDETHFAAAFRPIRPNDVTFHAAEPGTDWEQCWIGNDIGGLLLKDIGGGALERSIAPKGPPLDLVYDIEVWNDVMWIAPGGVDETWTGRFVTEPIFGMRNGNWRNVDLDSSWNSLAGVKDILAVAIDPLDDEHAFFGSWEEGVIEVSEGKWDQTYNANNSTLEPLGSGEDGVIRVAGLDFDPAGNLWVTSALSDKPLHVRRTDGSWSAMPLNGALSDDEFLTDVLATRQGMVVAIVSRGNGLLVYNTNETLDNLADDDWVRLGANEADGLASNDVYALEEDLDGEIWAGTASGPSVLYVPSALFNGDPPVPAMSSILIEQDGNFQLLLETEVIRCITIDGGNRKWVGTAGSGAYLLSEDGTETLAHFTAANSPLPSDNITDIAINHRTGEVFIGTEAGMMRYTGEATNFVREIDALTIYPNPVRPEHTGPITIDGCAYNSTVTITDAAGRLVAQLNSEGGRAVWNGLDINGQAVSYGMYYAFVVDRFGESASVSAFAIVR